MLSLGSVVSRFNAAGSALAEENGPAGTILSLGVEGDSLSDAMTDGIMSLSRESGVDMAPSTQSEADAFILGILLALKAVQLADLEDFENSVLRDIGNA